MLHAFGLLLASIIAGNAHAATCKVDATVSCDTELNGTTGNGAVIKSDNSKYTCSNTNYPGAEKTWQFTPPAGTEVGLYAWVSASNLSDLDLIVQKSDCGATTGTCTGSSTNGTQTSEDLDFIADGSTYFVTLDDKKAIPGAGYDLSFACIGSCTSSNVKQTVTCSSDFSDSTNSGTDVLDYYDCGGPWVPQPQLNPEVIYSFTPQVSGSVTFNLDNMSKDLDLYVLEDVCHPTGASCLDGSTNAYIPPNVVSDSVTFNARVGHVYYIVVEEYDATGPGSYQLHFDDGQGGCKEDCDDGIDNDGDGRIDCADADCALDPVCNACADADLDGYTASSCGGTDCNDTVNAIHPGAAEVCNGLDDDCDGTVDDGVLTTWYRDSDGDTYGNTSSTTTACTKPNGYVPTSGDCDDTRTTVYPGAPEVCDGRDNDCDLAVDENPTNGTTYYRDADVDGYGLASSSTTACTQPAGYVTTSTDCLDTNAAVHPGATEICNGIDDDCDSQVDEGTSTTWYRDADADGFGTSATTQASCTQPAGYVASSTDCNDASAAIHPGATEICNTVDDDCDGQVDEGLATTWYRDADNDTYGTSATTQSACAKPAGYVAVSTDCNDTSATIHPGATELCNGIDDDCDGTVDDNPSNPSTWYADVDNDTYGNASSTRTACTKPAGYVANSTDCNDAAATVHPVATEICDGLDNDCNGQVDDNAVGVGTWYRDVDTDGYGVTANPLQQCSQPAGYVANSTDCNDANAAIHPGATEVCNAIDDDCDGVVDDGATGTSTWYADADGDAFGDAAASVVACFAPAGHVADATDCDDGAATVHPGATELCNGVDDDCDGTVDDGATTTYYTDADADGFGDGAAPVQACTLPTGASLTPDDCDDTDAAINPSGTERCNGLDDDCNLLVDDDPVDGSAFYADLDADTYGDALASVSGCTAPSGYVADDRDCDDADDTIHPGAVEVCDGVDQDCDGTIDDNATDALVYYEDADADTYGNAASTVTDCNAPAGYVADDTDCDDAAAGTNPGAVEIPYDGIDQDCANGDLVDVDGDGSIGAGAGGPDCADGDPSVNPSATELADGVDQDCDGIVDEGTDWYDDDGDGFAEAGGDCDDANAAASPALVEVDPCDTVDNDCDGVVDDGTSCFDDDGDGTTEDQGDCNDSDAAVDVGADEIPLNGIDDDCDGAVDASSFDPDGDGYDTAGGDCDQDDSSVFPGAPETADGVDDDCDGTIDEGTAAYDDDGDGYSENDGDCWDGNADVSPAATEDGANGVDDDCDGLVDEGGPNTDDDTDGYTEEGGDCDDANADVNPGAGDPTDGADNDCDGLVDEDALDVDGDGYTVTDGDCDDHDGWSHPGTAEFCDGVDNNCNAEIDEGCEVGDEVVDRHGKCGCDESGNAGGIAVLVGAMLFVRRRRS
jgi:hypothetical protein